MFRVTHGRHVDLEFILSMLLLGILICSNFVQIQSNFSKWLHLIYTFRYILFYCFRITNLNIWNKINIPSLIKFN